MADVTLDVPGMSEPASGRLISLPGPGRPRLNDVFLRRGRWPDPARPDEVLASEMFCEAHGFHPGDRLGALINGRRRELTIVGVALSPEYVYAIGQASCFRTRGASASSGWTGAAWRRRSTWKAASTTCRSRSRAGRRSRTSSPASIACWSPTEDEARSPQSLQMSAWTLDNELAQLQIVRIPRPRSSSCGVAAFILHIALARALAAAAAADRGPEGARLLERRVAWHYVKWALVIAAVGAVAGVVVGAWLGSSLIGSTTQFFRFPMLDYHLSPGSPSCRFAGSLIVAALGAQSAVRRAVRDSAGGRPCAPSRQRATAAASSSCDGVRFGCTLVMRMIVRTLERQPARRSSSRRASPSRSRCSSSASRSST